MPDRIIAAQPLIWPCQLSAGTAKFKHPASKRAGDRSQNCPEIDFALDLYFKYKLVLTSNLTAASTVMRIGTVITPSGVAKLKPPAAFTRLRKFLLLRARVIFRDTGSKAIFRPS